MKHGLARPEAGSPSPLLAQLLVQAVTVITSLVNLSTFEGGCFTVTLWHVTDCGNDDNQVETCQAGG